MRRNLLIFFLSFAVFLAFFLLITAALKSDLFARFAFVRPLLIGGAVLFWGAWAVRLIFSARWIPPPVRERVLHVLHAIAHFLHSLIFSPRVGLIFAIVVFCGTALFSTWYASLGLFPQFPPLENLYIDQAEAFLSGQLFLHETPSPELLALSDPYSFEQRNGIPYLWDASLYDGKYYLYWGPAPALILAGVIALMGGPVPASLMVLLSAVLISAVLLVLLWSIYRCIYPSAPALSMGIFLLVAGVNLPLLFLLGRGRAYETSIMTGQLFLLLGIAGFFYSMRSSNPAWLLLAGFGWGFAVACRYNLAISVAVFVFGGMYVIWRYTGNRKAALRKAAFLLVPLAVCAVGLGVYNWLRFDNPLETGLKYQLTTPVNQNQHFSPAYLRTSWYLNVLYPYRKQEAFPVIRAIAVVPQDAPAWVNYHPGKRNDETIFSLRLVPFFWLMPLLLFLQSVRWWLNRREPALDRASEVSGWVEFRWVIAVAGLLQFVILLFYYYSAVRFMADYALLFLLTTIFLLWALDRSLARHPGLRAVMWIITVLAVASTVLLGFLAGFDNPPRVFEVYSPAVEASIGAAWNHIYTSPTIIGKGLRYLVLLFL